MLCDVSNIHPSAKLVCKFSSLPPWIKIFPSSAAAAKAMRGDGREFVEVLITVQAKVDREVLSTHIVENGNNVA